MPSRRPGRPGRSVVVALAATRRTSTARSAAVAAGLAARAGLDGLVCSAQEAQALKVAHPTLQLVTPGIRPAGSAQDDQRRILTPRQALEVGSDYLVIGRPITQATDPAQALAAVVAELA